MRTIKFLLLSIFLLFCLTIAATPASAASRKEMIHEAAKALDDLYRTTPGAKALGDSAKGILVFPGITKGGFIVGGQYGEGVLFKNGKAVGFYNTASASFGMQAGLQNFGYALFFMTDSDLKYLDKSEGWQLGVGTSITIVDAGFAKSLSTTTGREGVYAFFFDQKGLMAGLGIQGSKITKITPK